MEDWKKKPITVGANDGDSVSILGDTYRILISGEQTGGAFSTIDMLIPTGGGPGPHAHPDFEESFYVIAGEIEVKSEYGTYTAIKGSFINIPKGGVIHEFKNKALETAHLLCTVVPAGLETFFKEVGKPVASGAFLPCGVMDPESTKKLQEIAERHGQKVYPPNYLD